MVIDELRDYDAGRPMPLPQHQTIDEYVLERVHEREKHEAERPSVKPGKLAALPQPIIAAPCPPPAAAPARVTRRVTTRYLDRRSISLLDDRKKDRRRKAERRRRQYAIPFPDRRLTRSAYEQVFLKLVSGGKLRVGGELYTPVGMKGWYHAVFRKESDGSETLITIDELLRKMGDWT